MTGKGKGFAGVCAIVTLVSAAAIVWFSGQNGSQSSALSRSLAAWVLSLLSMEVTAKNLALSNFILRKMAHFGLYFLLGMGLAGVVGRRKGAPAALAVVALGGLFAVSDEFHQRFSQGRSPSGWDVALDTCGVAVGWAVFEILRWWKEKRSPKI